MLDIELEVIRAVVGKCQQVRMVVRFQTPPPSSGLRWWPKAPLEPEPEWAPTRIKTEATYQNWRGRAGSGSWSKRSAAPLQNFGGFV